MNTLPSKSAWRGSSPAITAWVASTDTVDNGSRVALFSTREAAITWIYSLVDQEAAAEHSKEDTRDSHLTWWYGTELTVLENGDIECGDGDFFASIRLLRIDEEVTS